MNKKLFGAVIVTLIIVVIGAVLMLNNNKDKKTNTSNTINSYTPNEENISNTENNENPISTEQFNCSPENVTIKIDNSTISAESVSITITDNNENHYAWGVEFRVQEKDNGEWKDLKYVSDNLSWIDIAYELNKDNQLTQKLDIKKYYGELSNGIYRIVKPVYDNEYIDIYSNEFEIK